MTDSERFAAAGYEGFDTPEKAAIESFPRLAKPRVIRAERFSETHVHVIVDTDPSHPMRVRCEKEGTLWYVSSDGNDV